MAPHPEVVRLRDDLGRHANLVSEPPSLKREESFREALASLEAAHDREVAKLTAQLHQAKQFVRSARRTEELTSQEATRQGSAATPRETSSPEEAFLPKDKARVTGPMVSGVVAHPMDSDKRKVLPPSNWSMQRKALSQSFGPDGTKEAVDMDADTEEAEEDSIWDWLLAADYQELSLSMRWAMLAGKMQLRPPNEASMLAAAGSTNWDLLPVWALAHQPAARHNRSQVGHKASSPLELALASTCLDGPSAGDTKTDHSSRLQPLILHPNSLKVLFIRLCGACAILLDCILIPLGSFDLQEFDGPFQVVTTGTSIFWVMDLISCFFIGEEIDGVVELRPDVVARRYLTSWFVPDVLILLLDLLLWILEAHQSSQVKDGASYNNLGFIKVLRLIRLVRLMRIMKLGNIKNNVLYRLNSGALILAFKITGMVLAILALNHYVACMWCAIGIFNEAERTWIVEYEMASAGFKLQYLAALHWALTQFSPATNNIAPQNLLERSFAILVVLFAMIVFSSFISSVTNAVNQLRAINMERIKDESRILDFISTRKINSLLAIKIHRFVKENYQRCKTRVKERDIQLFEIIPESMRIQLHAQMYMHLLDSNPMIGPSIRVDRQLATKVCHVAFSESSYIPRQDVFVDGFEAKCVFVVIVGQLEYSSVYYDYVPQKAGAGDWVGELAIWVDWTHRGQFTATCTSEMALLDCARFRGLLSENGGPMLVALRKLALFLSSYCEVEDQKYDICHVNSVKNTFVVPITDLPLEKQAMQDLADRASRLWKMKTEFADLIGGEEQSGRAAH